MPTLKAAILLAATGTASAASEAATCLTRAPVKATGFTYEDFGDYQRINSTACDETYILYPRDKTRPNLGTGVKYFGVPLNNVVLTQTPPISMIETIGARSRVKYASQYTSSACMAKQVTDGVTTEYVGAGWGADPAAAHMTQMDDADIEAIFIGNSKGSWKHTASEDKLICVAATFEAHPVDSAEWIKFFGYFFDASPAAQFGYCATSSRYECNSLSAKGWSSYNVPKVLFASYSDYYKNYKLAMPAFQNQLITDAGAAYPDLSAYASKGSPSTGYTFTVDEKADFQAALALADVIIDETYPAGQTLETIATMYGLDDVAEAKWPKAFTSSRVYARDATMDSKGAPLGGNDYFESRVAEPDGYFSDLVKVLFPVDNNYSPDGMTYLRPAAKPSAITVVTGAMCTDVNAPRAIRAATCDEMFETNKAVLAWLASQEVATEKEEKEEKEAPDEKAANLETSDAQSSTITALVVVVAAFGAVLVSVGIYLVMMNKLKGQKGTKGVSVTEVSVVTATSNAA